jgi:hypothetical protein
MAAKRTPKPKQELPRVHPDLAGFNIEINSLGEIKTNYDLDKLNLFLNKNVKDKKFRGREDIEGVPEAFKEAADPAESLPWQDPDKEQDTDETLPEDQALPTDLEE